MSRPAPAGAREEERCLARALEGVPEGTVLVEGLQERGSAHLSAGFQAETSGRGRVQVYPVYPGIEAAYQAYQAGRVTFRHPPAPQALELHHCRGGRIGWDMREGTSVYLGAGDLALHSMDQCAESAMELPLGWSMGLAFTVDLDRLEAEPPEILREAGFSAGELARRLCGRPPAAIPAGAELEGIFAPLYAVGEPLRPAWLKLKAQELLLYLSGLPLRQGELAQYGARQTQQVREAHQLLTEDLSRRYTIEELSRLCHLNASSLKEVFKAVYGLPIATYMKGYRARRAMELLREGDESVAAIAAQVGYETQGKFARAFQDVTGQLPTEYRRQCREGGGAGPR